MKKIATLIALLSCAYFCFADEEYFKTRLNLLTLEDAMQVYEGKWQGVQNLSNPDGSDVANFKIEQNYYWTVVDNQKVLVGQGFLTYMGSRIDMVTQMRMCKGYIELVLIDTNGEKIYYKGVLIRETLIWTPLYQFFLMDLQKDEFRKDDDYINFYSENLKFMKAGADGLATILIGRTAMRKERAKPVSEEAAHQLIKRGKGSLFE